MYVVCSEVILPILEVRLGSHIVRGSHALGHRSWFIQSTPASSTAALEAFQGSQIRLGSHVKVGKPYPGLRLMLYPKYPCSLDCCP